MKIAFGTSGWRGHLAYDFTFQGVACVAKAIADVLHENGQAEQGVVVGRDPRFLTEKFARDSARIFAAEGVRVFLVERDIPTPMIAWTIMDKKLAGGLNFTASHNPSDWCGVKYSMESGGPALPHITKKIEAIANKLLADNWQPQFSNTYEVIDPRESYYRQIESIINFDLLRQGRFALNPIFGAARGILDELLQRNNVPYDIINDTRDPYFGGFPPEPAEEYIADFIRFIDPAQHTLGLMCDGDADRFGVLTPQGECLNPNDVATVLAWYLIGVKNMPGGTGRSVATTHMLDRVARHFGREHYETPVGFKWLGELICEDKIALAAEESAGMSIYRHVPEKDGIIAVLLLAEAVCHYQKGFFEILQDVRESVGQLICKRVNIALEGVDMEKLKANLAKDVTSVGEFAVQEVVRTDGVKFLFGDDRWILVRLSGTEPVARVYAEGADESVVSDLLAAGKRFLLS